MTDSEESGGRTSSLLLPHDLCGRLLGAGHLCAALAVALFLGESAAIAQVTEAATGERLKEGGIYLSSQLLQIRLTGLVALVASGHFDRVVDADSGRGKKEVHPALGGKVRDKATFPSCRAYRTACQRRVTATPYITMIRSP